MGGRRQRATQGRENRFAFVCRRRCFPPLHPIITRSPVARTNALALANPPVRLCLHRRRRQSQLPHTVCVTHTGSTRETEARAGARTQLYTQTDANDTRSLLPARTMATASARISTSALRCIRGSSCSHSLHSPLTSVAVAAHRSFYSYVNEPAHPIPGKTPKWATAEEAVSVVKSGRRHASQSPDSPLSPASLSLSSLSPCFPQECYVAS